jgi:ParB family protein of integrating conjugative element (PFGI_1 class)
MKTQIREGHYGDNVAELLPIDPTSMMLSLDQIREYDHNPRRELNPKYNEIKEVILAMRARGEPIRMTVTRRPEERDKPYMVHAGGNSFLKALREIYKETQDAFFEEIDCLFVPWRSESAEIIAHLIENDVRGDLVFIDRAQSVVELRKEIEQDLGEEVSQRRLAEILAERGYRVGGQPAISRMEYAVNTLLPCIPLALAAGLGKHKIAEIRKYEEALRQSIDYMGMGDRMDAAYQIWLDSLAQFDSWDEWDFEFARRHVLSRLEELTGEDSGMICARIDAALEGGVPGIIGSLESEPLIQRRPRRTRKQDPEPPVEASGDTTPEAGSDGSTEAPSASPQPETPMPAAATLAPGPSPSPASTALSQAQGQESAQPDSAGPSEKDLRARMWTLAMQIAGRNGLDECVLHIGHAGGYVMDMPPKSLKLDADADLNIKRTSLWWFLGSLVDQWSMFDEVETIIDVVGMVPEDSGVYAIVSAYLNDSEAHQVQRDQATETLIQLVAEPGSITMPLVCRWLFAELDDVDFKTLVELIDTRRRFAEICRKQNKRYLWEL